jgi:HD-like signal output (HDOD) protein
MNLPDDTSMEPLSPELGNRLRSAIERMPAFPKSVQRILELTRDLDCAPKEVVAVVEKDPVIAVKILKLLNSAHYNLPARIASVSHAVVFLGMNTVKNLALNFSAAGILPRDNAAGFDVQRYLLHALLSASLGRRLALRYAADEVGETDAYLAGLLHNFGKLVLAQFMAEQFSQALALSASEGIPLHEAEERVIGASHAVVGGMLIEHWQFPQALAQCVALHHDGVGETPLGQCLHVADRLALRLLAADEGCEDAGPIAARFGAGLDGVLAELGNTDTLLAEARLFCHEGH